MTTIEEMLDKGMTAEQIHTILSDNLENQGGEPLMLVPTKD